MLLKIFQKKVFYSNKKSKFVLSKHKHIFIMDYDDLLGPPPEEKENECSFCTNPCEGTFCSKDCEVADLND